MRGGGGGSKKYFCLLRVKKLSTQGGGGVEKWQNSVHVIVERPLWESRS